MRYSYYIVKIIENHDKYQFSTFCERNECQYYKTKFKIIIFIFQRHPSSWEASPTIAPQINIILNKPEKA
jgi:hypothetical protein